MKVVLISSHDAAAPRRTGFHFWADIMAARGIDVDFVTVGSSPISLFKKNGKQLKRPFNQWVEIAPRIHKYTWMPVFHPLNLSPALNKITTPLFRYYSHLMGKDLLSHIQDANLFIVESGAGALLVPRLAKLFPKACFIYNFSDRYNAVDYHPVIRNGEKEALPHFKLIRTNAKASTQDFEDGKAVYIPQAIDKAAFEREFQNPYQKNKNAISVGDMLFDEVAIGNLAKTFPDWTFHLFGKGARMKTALPNVVEYGEKSFDEIIPYLKHADIGLAPYKHANDLEYLSQSSLKLVQYTYCKLPIVAPDFAAHGREHAFGYGSEHKAMENAFQQAIHFDRNMIDRSSITSWEDIVDRYLSVLKASE